MMTSINVQPVKAGSEEHNKRLKFLDYVRPELSHQNQYWQSDTQSSRLASIKENVKAKTGRAMQAKATPIREAVVIINESTSMDDLRELAASFKEKFGIETFQIAIHKDEGHVAAKEWKPNLHAHMVFDWTDQETGKSIKLNRDQMAAMQTITAEVLGMERGKSSERKHLSALQYKLKVKQEELLELENKAEELSRTVGTGARILSWFGVGELAAIRKRLREGERDVEAYKASLSLYKRNSEERVAKAQGKAIEAENRAITAEKQLSKVREENSSLQEELRLSEIRGEHWQAKYEELTSEEDQGRGVRR